MKVIAYKNLTKFAEDKINSYYNNKIDYDELITALNSVGLTLMTHAEYENYATQGHMDYFFYVINQNKELIFSER